MNETLKGRVEEAFAARLARMSVSRDPERVRERWTAIVDNAGARRLSRLLSMVIDTPDGFVRVVDPLQSGGSQGLIEMSEETAERIAALGVP